MSDEELPLLRHVILYAKGHYYWSRVVKDLLRICSKVNSKASKIQHIIMMTGEVVYGAIQEFSEENTIPGKDDLGPVDAYKNQWLFLTNLREHFDVSWQLHPEFHRLTDEEKAELEKIFQEEFDNRIMQAYLVPLAGWRPNFDLGNADGKILPVVSPKKKD
jgi:hypothetical protein